MADIVNPTVVVSMPAQLFTMARAFKGASNGTIYIGKIDTDPTIPANQIQVYLQNEDGSTTPVSQPLVIGTGGYPVYGGQIAKFVTTQGHSMAVYDAYNVQQFYFPNVLKYDPDQFRNSINFITPEMFGAVGDASADDTTAWEMLWDYVAENGGPNRQIGVCAARNYRITRALAGKSYSDVYGGGSLYYDGENVTMTTMLTYSGQSFFTISALALTRNNDSPFTLWSKSAHGIVLNSCADFFVDGVDAYMHTDAISVTDSDRFTVQNCKAHKLGEEGVAVRRCRNFTVFNNEIFEHNGDGILLKTASAVTHTGSVIDNRIHDGISSPGTAAGQKGGGITLNDENFGGGGSSTSFSNLTVSRNHIYGTSYGIAFTNIVNLTAADNQIHDISRFGLIIDTAVFNNPNKNPINKSIVTGNNIRNVGQAGIAFTGTSDISVKNTIIANNILDTCGTSSINYPSLAAGYAVVTSNIILNSNGVGLQVNDCATSANRIIGSNNAASGATHNWIKVAGSGSFVGNHIEDDKFGHIRLDAVQNLVFADNSIKLASTFAGIYFESAVDASTVKFSGNKYDVAYAPVTNFNIGTLQISQLQTTLAEFGRRVRVWDGSVPAIPAVTGDELISITGAPGTTKRWVCTTAGNPGVYTPVEWVPVVASSTSQSLTITNGQTVNITANNANIGSGFMCTAAKFNQDPKGVSVTASVSAAGTVKFVLTNRTGFDQAFTGLVLTAHCHE
ncbi:phage tailspike protein [Serratia marcescens]|uniref:phage tailspike protein n=1 Tax=Serratia marcescens TaxID=615 RepID=UPI000F7E6DD4|nr:phage tailspike protein [Serratia marcescens]RTF49646.1 hypothetical protein D9B78_07635 [Serratia marcescens]